MAKQTEKKNKSSKKNYSFTGHRTIGNDKNQHLDNDLSNTTEEMQAILETENPVVNNNYNLSNLSGLLGTNQLVPTNIPVNMPMMGTMPQQNQINNFNTFGDVDPTLVNTLAPINNNNLNGYMNSSNLMGPSQMAQAMGSLANLSKLSNTQNMNAFSETQQSLMGQNPMNQMSNLAMNQLNNSLGMNQFNNLGMNQLNNLGMNQQPAFNLANLAALNTPKMI